MNREDIVFGLVREGENEYIALNCNSMDDLTEAIFAFMCESEEFCYAAILAALVPISFMADEEELLQSIRAMKKDPAAKKFARKFQGPDGSRKPQKITIDLKPGKGPAS